MSSRKAHQASDNTRYMGFSNLCRTFLQMFDHSKWVGPSYPCRTFLPTCDNAKQVGLSDPGGTFWLTCDNKKQVGPSDPHRTLSQCKARVSPGDCLSSTKCLGQRGTLVREP